MDILISGAGIAGPSLAFWLRRFGFAVTVVERAPAPRDGGQAVDFRGTAHMTVLRRMGLLDEIRRQQTTPADMVFVDEHGRRRAVLPAEFTAGEVEILRGRLSRILYEATRDDVEYLFGDTITSLAEDESGVDVTFQHAPPRRFGLVIGADGMHSAVRGQVFSGRLDFLGYHVAGFASDGHEYCNVPGRLIGDGLIIFKSAELTYDRRDLLAQKEIVADACAGVGWRVPEIVRTMCESDDFFFGPVSRLRMDRITRGRVALIGDAAYGTTFGGMGTGLAIVSAYVLAGSLATHRSHTEAFAEYESLVRPYAKGCQGNPGPFLAPATKPGLWLRNRLFGVMARLPLEGMFARMDIKAANNITLPDYARPPQVR
ncbi:FAD-dependent oxidoreductase [Lentzea sp. NBRC 105346]|uniref:FAD-dependent monooxygenase n=1 Tax=Lentzea sp. NBRC 105346 TaxID=3032205 RepID=UPI0024A30D01|nr:FAD-dependent monooxygenase [Lentzea sp. NBRC 105346]GLZ30029.1 FAD-dependent oxidoreductase [Lentzea sp. NBRC 105346]